MNFNDIILKISFIHLFLFTQFIHAERKKFIINLLDDSKIILDSKSLNLHFTPTDDFNELPSFNFKLDDILELKLSLNKPKDNISSFQNAINNLRHPNFKTRENAASHIIRLGNGFQNIIKKTINNSFDPEVRWRLREALKKLPVQTNSGFDQLRTLKGKYSGHINDFKIESTFLGQKIILHRSEIKSIHRLNPSDRPSVFYGKKESTRPITDILIDFEDSLQDEGLKEGNRINDKYINYGIRLGTKSSYLTVSNITIPGVSGKYSATNFNPIYEGEIRGSFTEINSPNPSGVHYLGLSLGLIKPESVVISIYDNKMNEITSAKTKSLNSESINFVSYIPISHFKIQPISNISPTVVISDLWFTKPKKRYPETIDGVPIIIMKSGDQIKCKQLKFTSSLKGDDSYVIISPNANFSKELKIRNDSIKSFIFSTESKIKDMDSKKYFWALLEDGTKLIMQLTDKSEPISKLNNLPINKLSLSAIWSANGKIMNPQDNFKLKRNEAAIFIRKDPIYINDFLINQDSISGKRNDGTKITYQFSRVPTIWIKEPQKKIEKVTTINLKDGQKIECSKESLHKIHSLNEFGVKIKFGDNYINLQNESIQSIEY